MSDNNRPDAPSGEPLETVRTGRLGRRAVVKGAAWSLPVIATATALPAAAASTVADTDLGLSFTGTSFNLKNSLQNALSAALPNSVAGLLSSVVAAIGNISFYYPTDAIVTNIGSAPLDANESFGVSLNYGDSDVLDISALNSIGNVNAINTDSGADLTITSPTTVAPGGQVADIPLAYNPITVDINLSNLNDESPATATGVLTGDMSDNENTDSTEYGLNVELLPGFSAAVSALTGALSLLGIKLPTLTLDVLTN